MIPTFSNLDMRPEAIEPMIDFRERIQHSAIAVPPLARGRDLSFDPNENGRLIRHIEAGGVSTLLYGGNALFYHIRLSEYADVLRGLLEQASPHTWVIPSIGPAFGMMMDQAQVLRDMPFDTAMVLPQREIADETGIVEGLRRVVDRMGKPIVLYLKFDRWLSSDAMESLFADGYVSWIKYAVVQNDPNQDSYLREILQSVPRENVVSGMGEQPAIIHLRDFGLGGFTSGCVCIRPDFSARLWEACRTGRWETAEGYREVFRELEDLRNRVSPIRVLHAAVQASGIADVGPILPLAGRLESRTIEEIESAVRRLQDKQV
jgi:dihydrodipicolinate synthase/N-acetylneuraminate lyase